MMKRQIKTIQKNLDTCYIDKVYVYIRPRQGWPERGLLGLRQPPPPNILETTPALFNHIRKNEFPFTTILVGDCWDRHESSISELSASFRGN